MFRLLRYFAVTSAAVLIAVTILLFALYKQTATEEVLSSAEHGNTVLAQSLANAIWLYHANHIDHLAEPAETLHLDDAIKRLSVGLPVLKIKIFNSEGVVVYSTVPDEIGQYLDHNAEYFENAWQGNTSSEIMHGSDLFQLTDDPEVRDIVETYLPVLGPGGEVYGVFELYTDVTQRFNDIRQMATALLGGLVVGFAVLYGGLLLVVRWAEKIMRSQYVSLRASRGSLMAKNRELTAEIGRRIDIEAELREARDGAEAASRAKSQFLANMSHELRTPLNAVIGFSQIMVDEVLGRVSPSSYRQYAQDIRDSGHHLLALVNNVLDLAGIETGRIEIKLSSFDIHGVVQESAHAVAAELATNCNTLRVHCPRDLGTMVSDEIKVRGVLVNLISNAAKFTSNGLIEVEARLDSDGGDGCVMFRVSDTGIGMDEGRIEEMFDEFTQHDNSNTRCFGGTGLGLAICRRYCEALGGGITIESILGEGTTVTVRLPDKRQIEEVEYRPGTRDAASPSAV